MTTTRRLAAILAADVAGYSRLMGADEVGTLESLNAHRREVVDPAIAAHHGRIVKTTGDGLLVEFASAVDAVTCAVAVQQKLAEREASSPGSKIQFRIGINVGDVIVENDDIFGDGVNVAARLENECEPGGVLLSAQALDQVRGKTKFVFDDLGEKTLKNIDRPVGLFAVRPEGEPQKRFAGDGRESLNRPDKASIAVLPFQNMSGDPEQDYFADGIVEDITTALSRFSSLLVPARNTSFTYKGKAVDIKQVGRELGVRYVLEGSVRKAGSRVRITAQLIETATGTHLWAERFEGPLEDVFDLQDKVTSNVVGVVEPTILQIEIERALRKPTNNLEAYDYYLRGLAKYNDYTRPSNKEGDIMLAKAVELDPDFAAAIALQAHLRVQRINQGWTADEAKDIAEGIDLAKRSLELGRNDASALGLIAFVQAFFLGDVANAVTFIDRALALNPNAYGILEGSAWIRILNGEADLAIAHNLRALEINPRGTLRTPAALGYVLLGRNKEALAWSDQMVVLFPRTTTALRFAAMIKASLGQLEEARVLVKRILEIKPDSTTAPGPWIRYQQRPEYKQWFIDALRIMGQLGLPDPPPQSST